MKSLLIPLGLLAASSLLALDVAVAEGAKAHDDALACEAEPTRPQKLAKAVSRKVKPLSAKRVAKRAPEPCQVPPRPIVKGKVEAVAPAIAPATPVAGVAHTTANPPPVKPPTLPQFEGYPRTGEAPAPVQQAPVWTGHVPVVSGWGLIAVPVPVPAERWVPKPADFAPGSTRAWDTPAGPAFPPGATRAWDTAPVPAPSALWLVGLGLVILWRAKR